LVSGQKFVILRFDISARIAKKVLDGSSGFDNGQRAVRLQDGLAKAQAGF
jgi:hypothetical protein